MKIKAAVFSLAAAGASVNALGFDPRIVNNLRQQLSKANFMSGTDSLTYLKFYADNFLWSITELYKGFKNMYYDVQKLEDILSDNADQITEAEDILSGLQATIDSLEAAVSALQDKVDTQAGAIDDITQAQEDAQLDEFFENTFDGSGSAPWDSDSVIDAMKEHMGFEDMDTLEQSMAGLHLDQVASLIDNFDASSHNFEDFKDDLESHMNAAADM